MSVGKFYKGELPHPSHGTYTSSNTVAKCAHGISDSFSFQIFLHRQENVESSAFIFLRDTAPDIEDLGTEWLCRCVSQRKVDLEKCREAKKIFSYIDSCTEL